MLYKVLTAFEDAGRCQRGYFVESLGGAQFARRVDRRPAAQLPRRRRSRTARVPGGRAGRRGSGQPLRRGAALAASRGEADDGPGARPGRKAGALVVLVDGELAWFLERGGRSLLTFTDDPDAHHAAAAALADLVAAGASRRSWSNGSTGCRPCSRRADGPARSTRLPTPGSPALRADCGCADMPEGDTVLHTADRAARAPGRAARLTRCDVRVPRFATVDLTGHVVDEVLSRGKHLFIRVGTGQHSLASEDGRQLAGRRPPGAGRPPGANHLGNRQRPGRRHRPGRAGDPGPRPMTATRSRTWDPICWARIGTRASPPPT